MSRPTTSAAASRGRGHFAARYASQRVAASMEQIEFEACLPNRPFALRSTPSAVGTPSIEVEEERRPRSARLSAVPAFDSVSSLDAQEPFALSFAAPTSPLKLREAMSNNDYIYNDDYERSGSSTSRQRSVSPGSLWRRSRSTERTDLSDLLCSSSESESSRRIVSMPIRRTAASAKRSPGVSPSSSSRAPLTPSLDIQREEAFVSTLPFTRRPSASVSRSPSTGSYGLTRASSYALQTSLARRVSSGSSVNGSEAGTTSPRATARRLSSIYATTIDAPAPSRRKSSAIEATSQPLAALSYTPGSPSAAAQSGNLSKIFVADKSTRLQSSNTIPPILIRSSEAVAAPSLVQAQADAPLSPSRKSTASLAILHAERTHNTPIPSSPRQEVIAQSIEIQTVPQEVSEAITSSQDTLYGSQPPVPLPQRAFYQSTRPYSDSDSSGITLASESTVATPSDSDVEEEQEGERPSRGRVGPTSATIALRESRSRSRGRASRKLERRRFVKQISAPFLRSSALGLLDVTPGKDDHSAWPSLFHELSTSPSPHNTLPPLYSAAPGKAARQHLSASPALAPGLLGRASVSRRGSNTPRTGSTTPNDSVRSTPKLGKRALPQLHDVEELVVALSNGTDSRRGITAEEHERFVRARTSIVV